MFVQMMAAAGGLNRVNAKYADSVGYSCHDAEGFISVMAESMENLDQKERIEVIRMLAIHTLCPTAYIDVLHYMQDDSKQIIELNSQEVNEKNMEQYREVSMQNLKEHCEMDLPL